MRSLLPSVSVISPIFSLARGIIKKNKKLLKYLTGELNYGGRVTDGKDRRTLMHLLDVYYHPRVLEEDDCSQASGMIVLSPPAVVRDRTDFVAYIKTLPRTDAPEVFSKTKKKEKIKTPLGLEGGGVWGKEGCSLCRLTAKSLWPTVLTGGQ